MAEFANSPEPSPADAGKWIVRVMIAVILGEGIWGLIVSLTNNLILPSLARVMGADTQSPLYLGKSDFNVPALFTAVLELCFAAIVAVILNSWVRRKPRPIRSKSVRVSPIPAQPAASASPLSIAPVQAAVSVPPAKAPVARPAAAAPVVTSSAVTSHSPGQFWSPPEPSPQPKAAVPPPPPKAPARPAKPKQPKEVYYNIVGEPINPTEDE
jgi:hypothetical protein